MVFGKLVLVVTSLLPVRSSAARAALRGTSRIAAPPLPHLLQRGHACGRGVVSLGAWLETGDAAAMPTQKSSQPTKAGNHGLTGSARCNKCGSGGAAIRLVPRSAARAALDLPGAIKPKANTCTPKNNLNPTLTAQPLSAPGATRPRSAPRADSVQPRPGAASRPGRHSAGSARPWARRPGRFRY